MTVRREDDRLLRGRGRFVDDVDVAGQGHARVVRSQDPHARLLAVDTTAARAMPGVRLAASAADLPGDLRIPVRIPITDDDLSPNLQPVLASDRVRYVGEPVAVVVADDPYRAEDAAERVRVRTEALPPVIDPTRAAEAAPLRAAGNVAAGLTVGYGAVDEAFAGAAATVHLELDVGRHAAVPLETRGLLAAPADEGLELWGWTKVPHYNRRVLAGMLGLPVSRVRLHGCDAGGGFGARGEFYPEDFLVPWAALATGAPVKWVEDRGEHLVASNHSREQRYALSAAFDDGGLLAGLRAEVVHDNGAYVRTHGVLVAELAVTMLPGPYRVPAYHAHVSVVTTNKTPCGTYRAPGRYEGTFARERLLDAAADRLGVDPVELRRRNLLTPAELPLERGMRTLGTEIVLDPGDYPGLLDATLDGVGYGDWRAAAASARRDGRLAGTGVACLLEKSGLGPYETARVDVQPDGRVRAATGGTSVGQGIETVIATIVADELGVAPDDVEVRHGDTDLVPDGVGSWASRSTVVGGSAALDAAGRVADTARRVGAGLLGVDEDKVALADGRVRITGGPPAGSGVGEVSLAEVAAACAPPAGGAGLGSDGHFAVQRMTYPYGVHCCLVEVDPETGGVTVQRYAVGYEVGRAINRQLVEGQLAGGVAQGLGGALMEEFAYDGVSGQPLATTFIDYLLPTAAEVPDVTVLVFEDAPAPDNPLGAHGAGEGGVSAVGAAVAGAVADALGVADSVQSLPLAPALVRRAVRRADPGRAAQPSG